MLRVKWVGNGEAPEPREDDDTIDGRDVAVPGGFLTCPWGEWVDLVQAAKAALIPVHHVVLAFLGLVEQPGWQVNRNDLRALARDLASADLTTGDDTSPEGEKEKDS